MAKQKLRKAIFIFIVSILTVLSGFVIREILETDLSVPEITFNLSKRHFRAVAEYIASSSHGRFSLSLDDPNREVRNSATLADIESRSVRRAVNRLRRRGVDIILSNDCIVLFQIVSVFRHYASGVVYSICGNEVSQATPGMENATYIRPLDEPGWFLFEYVRGGVGGRISAN